MFNNLKSFGEDNASTLTDEKLSSKLDKLTSTYLAGQQDQLQGSSLWTNGLLDNWSNTNANNLSSLFKLISVISTRSGSLNEPDAEQSYGELFAQLKSLYSDFGKLKLDLILNELKLEVNYLIEELKTNMRNEFNSKLKELVYEQSVLNAKLASVEFKLALRAEEPIVQSDDPTNDTNPNLLTVSKQNNTRSRRSNHTSCLFIHFFCSF